jgi:putative phosphonate metabolism protein
MDEPRYAIYFVPPANSDLYCFGASFLGYDCYTGADLRYPPDAGLNPSTWVELTREPCKYGFHATLKAPFHLLPTFAEADLAAELRRFAAIPRTLPAIEPTIQPLARFIAIVAQEPSVALDGLAADCVVAFDRFRRPLTANERQQRLGSGLSDRQIENLDRWGYPYVLEDFRFHMTLTGPIDAAHREPILAALKARFAKISGDKFLPITQLVLLRQETSSTPFRALDRIELTAGRADRQTWR